MGGPSPPIVYAHTLNEYLSPTIRTSLNEKNSTVLGTAARAERERRPLLSLYIPQLSLYPNILELLERGGSHVNINRLIEGTHSACNDSGG